MFCLRSIFIFLFSIGLLSCQEELETGLEVGGKILKNDIRVIEIDTLTVNFSTYRLDSIITSNTSRILVGQYTDPIFGKINAKSYFEVLPSHFNLSNHIVYDSICMVLKYDNYYIYDTLQPCTYEVKRISEKVRPSDGENHFYNTSHLSTFEIPLGQKTFYPNPLSEKDSLIIRLDDMFGLSLFQKIQDDEITNQDEFLEYLKGIMITPNANDNASILGFSTTNSVLRIYYKDPETDENQTGFYDFIPNVGNTPAKFFNQIDSDRSNTVLNELENQTIELLDSEMGQTAFAQSGVGIVTKIDIPYLKNLLDFYGNENVLNAYLNIVPNINLINTNISLPEQLFLHTIDNKNNLLYPLYNASQGEVIASLIDSDKEFNEYYYTVNLYDYIETLLQTQNESDYGIILKTPNFDSSLSIVVLDTSKSGENSTFLSITLVVYE